MNLPTRQIEKLKLSDFRTETHSPVMRLSHEHVESLLQPYSFLLAGKFAMLSWSHDNYSPRIVARFARLSRDESCVLASSVASLEARTSACNSRGRRKAVPCCAPFRGQKVERTIVRIEAIDEQSIQTLRATEARVRVRCDSKDDRVLRRR